MTTPSVFTDSLPLPRLLVFDLDYTLWPFWIDTHLVPPMAPAPSATRCEAVTDRHNDTYAFYPEVERILLCAARAGCALGLASRTSAPDLAREMLGHLTVAGEGGGPTGNGEVRKAWEMFEAREIYPGSKTVHFQRIHKRTGIEYKEMLFFDDETRNRNVEQLGVVMKLVRDGVTVAEVEKGVKEWRRRNGRTQKEG